MHLRDKCKIIYLILEGRRRCFNVFDEGEMFFIMLIEENLVHKRAERYRKNYKHKEVTIRTVFVK